ncbi:MAG TPA: serine--tRNA ligase [Candidatus Nanoarchaeia archaeon]|nr:serine--tRNA ligase [Candidatus Nanoarchaeia archaeon]
MLDIKLIRENSNQVKASEKKRNRDPKLVDEVLKLDLQWKTELASIEKLKHQRNVVSQEINQLKKSGKSAVSKIKQMQSVGEDIKSGEEKVKILLEKRDAAVKTLGNVMHPKVPPGKDDSQNVELKKVGKIPKFSFPLKNHVELAEQLGWADFDSSAKTSGNGFYFLKGDLALLNQALIRFTVDFMHSQGYLYIEPPLLIRKRILEAAIDVQEWDKTIYSIKDEDLALIGTSEHALLGIHSDETLSEKDFPKKYFSYSMCFRKEVGAHGINEKGLWRTHQFNKIEQFIFCKPEESDNFFLELLNNSEGILKALGLPYRVIEICSGDLSLWKQRSYDVEVWRPTTNSYGEVMSLSNCTDYQARKLGIKVVYNDGSREVVHTLNNTALATSRIMVALLENFQTKKGTVKIPQVLGPYMQGKTELGPIKNEYNLRN